DYQAYQSIVQTLMMQPRFTVVIFRGGILSRICSKFISPEELLKGPSLDSQRYGLRWHGKDGFCYLEDYISEEEVELLIGMFYIRTG
ncbi:hypothetical protein BU15DRAFT_10617, partial [Melanogaster broomeanus]